MINPARSAAKGRARARFIPRAPAISRIDPKEVSGQALCGYGRPQPGDGATASPLSRSLRADRNKSMECETSLRPEALAAATGILRGGAKTGRPQAWFNRETGRC